jgi:hypothetical protein
MNVSAVLKAAPVCQWLDRRAIAIHRELQHALADRRPVSGILSEAISVRKQCEQHGLSAAQILAEDISRARRGK